LGKSSFYVDKADPQSVNNFLDIVGAGETYYENAIRTALRLHERPFLVYFDHVHRPQVSPLQDAFTFNMETDELVMFTDSPAQVIDALLEMAMFVRGFNTLMGVEQEWKIQVAIGAWRRVRESLKARMSIQPAPEKVWSADLELETVERYNAISFGAMVFLAGRPDVELIFPEGASALVIGAYQRLMRIIEAIALNVGLDDHQLFNRRLNRALQWIEETIMPRDFSPFDDFFGPEGFSDSYFEGSPED